MNPCQIKDILSDVEFKYRDALCYTGFLCLSRGRMFKHVYGLKSEIELFLEMKRKLFFQLCLHDRMCDFSFFTVISPYELIEQ
jgi:hypothetical protein